MCVYLYIERDVYVDDATFKKAKNQDVSYCTSVHVKRKAFIIQKRYVVINVKQKIFSYVLLLIIENKITVRNSLV